ncbi:MAG TPA: alpha/beta fold hydrolase [Stellaceae bacterium]|nr:alpha/beta fold hydrolase [Stellaceae bacterium]
MGEKLRGSRAIVLVHGAGHGAWCWEQVVPRLERKGYHVAALDLPGLGDDPTPARDATFELGVARVVDAVRAAPGPVLLLGHSAGGIVISQAAENAPDSIGKLVYLAACLPVDGESLRSMIEITNRHPGPSAMGVLRPSDVEGAHGFAEELAAETFYNTCDPGAARRAIARLRPQPDAPLGVPVALSPERFGRVAKSYIVCARDQALPPGAQHFMCERMPGVTKHVMDCDHSPFFCAPDGLVEIIDREARGD